MEKNSYIVIRIAAALVLTTHAVNNISEPSDLYVYIGILEVIAALVILYPTARTFFKQL